MKGFAAEDLQATDLLALARLDDDGAPPAVTPATGQGRHVMPLADARQVTASQTEMIAAAPRPSQGPGRPHIAAVADWGQACRGARLRPEVTGDR